MVDDKLILVDFKSTNGVLLVTRKENKHNKAINKKNVQTIEEDFKKLQIEYEDIKDTLQRIQAEFSNFRKRTEDEKSKFINLATVELIKKILPVIDNFELALEAHEEETEFYKGINMIYSQLQEVMADEGLTPIKESGKFDPNVHEAILTEESDKPNNEVLEVLQKGYKIGDRVIRHAKVKISKNKTNGGNKNE